MSDEAARQVPLVIEPEALEALARLLTETVEFAYSDPRTVLRRLAYMAGWLTSAAGSATTDDPTIEEVRLTATWAGRLADSIEEYMAT